MNRQHALRLIDILANWMASEVPISEREDLKTALTVLRTEVGGFPPAPESQDDESHLRISWRGEGT